MFTPAELAKILRIRVTTLYEALKRGEIDALRVGRQWRIPKKEVERLLTGGRANA
jgi:putative molybdopterin biosynthesis protein